MNHKGPHFQANKEPTDPKSHPYQLVVIFPTAQPGQNKSVALARPTAWRQLKTASETPGTWEQIPFPSDPTAHSHCAPEEITLSLCFIQTSCYRLPPKGTKLKSK